MGTKRAEERSDRLGIDVGSASLKAVLINDGEITTLPILQVQGNSLTRVKQVLETISQRNGKLTHVKCGITGVGAELFAGLVGLEPLLQYQAWLTAFGDLYPDVRTIFEMGLHGQSYVPLARDPNTGQMLAEDSRKGTKCAAGSGSFADYMVERLKYSSREEFAKAAMEAEHPAALSGRCIVYTETDIVHLFQKGTTRDNIAAGIHRAIARNFRKTVVQKGEIHDRVAFIGGVSQNPAAVKFLEDEFGVELFVPEHSQTMGAIGSAMRAEVTMDIDEAIKAIEVQLSKPYEYEASTPIRLEKSTRLAIPFEESLWPACIEPDLPLEFEQAGLGIDIGSTSTKAALVGEVKGKSKLLAYYYRRTDGDPILAVQDTLAHIGEQIRKKGFRIETIVAATTGSGRYLTGDYVGADFVKNEIVAQVNGTLFFFDDVDTIFEIGGQDGKYMFINGEVIEDFEMNKACSAGTGAFLERVSQRLGIPLQEYGDIALGNTRPPDLNSKCTVFSESAMLNFALNNVPVEDLAAGIALASVKNYLQMNVGSRPIGKKIAFQGAPAFNKAMVAAYETVLDREVVVPPLPHLTGPIGVARIACRAKVDESHFVGFDRIAKAEYERGSFECRNCDNRCDVITFKVEGGKTFYYNDRCEKYSGQDKKSKGEGLPDLFAEREDMLMESCNVNVPDTAQPVGVPRGLMFSEYGPLYCQFLAALGFKPVVSDATSSKIINKGLDVALGEMCFPAKVAHGHPQDWIDAGIQTLFLPAVYETEQPNPKMEHSHTCPYVCSAPDVIRHALRMDEKGVKLVTPRLHFNRGIPHLQRQFVAAGKELGKTGRQAKKAFQTGLEALQEFRRKVDQRARQVMNELPDNQLAIVVIGRPYTLWDKATNMDIGRKIRDLGILPIPQDFLPLEEADISDDWPNAYSRQVAKKLQAARLIRQDPRLKAIVLTYFGCGPDSFANPFFKGEVNEPCYVMQIDEHTADAGVITRIEAFSDTVRNTVDVIKEFHPVRSKETPIGLAKERKIWIPRVNESAEVLAASLRAFGYDSEVLPRSPNKGLDLGRQAISEDVCVPMLYTTEDILYRVSQPDFDRGGEGFFQGKSTGPCRFGCYTMGQRMILDQQGYPDVPIVSLGRGNEEGGMGLMFPVVALSGIMTHDLLFKMMLKTRPYELNPGESEELFARCISDLTERIVPAHARHLSGSNWKTLLSTEHLGDHKGMLNWAQKRFSKLPVKHEPRPLVGVVGEFYVRLHDEANQDILRFLEAAGVETWLAPESEFFTYIPQLCELLAFDKFKRDKMRSRDQFEEWVKFRLNNRIIDKSEHALYEETLPFLADRYDIGAAELITLSEQWLCRDFGGEAACSMGKSEDWVTRRNVHGVVSTIPFNCMPGLIVASLSQAFRRRHGNVPFLTVDFDGYDDAGRREKLLIFVGQVVERFEGARLL